jgi:glycosyltransferase involved in cell wall biosynthesis
VTEIRLTPEAFAKRPGGVRRTALSLVGALREAGANVSLSRRIERSTTLTSDAPPPFERARLQLAEAAFFAGARLRGETGVAHSLYYDQQLRPAGWPLVVTVHDMIHERYGGGRALQWAKRLAVSRASLVLTPTHATANELRAHYPHLVTKVVPVPWGVADEFFRRPPASAVDGWSPFLLYVGPRSGYKNLDVLLRALGDTRDLDGLALVLVGGGAMDDAERAAIGKAIRRPSRIRHVEAPSDADLIRLYDNAAALVITSRSEGFGLPALEAMARRCPVACSDAAALLEVTNGHAQAFPADSASACAVAVSRAVAMRAGAREEARQHAHRYQWRTTARLHLDAYEAVAAAPSRRRPGPARPGR